MTPPTHTLLVVDDEPFWLTEFEKLGQSLGFIVLTAPGGDEAWDMLAEHPEIDIVITDVRMPSVDGLMVLQHLNRMDKPPKTLVHSSERTYRPQGGEKCDLAVWVKTYFGEFASFALKSVGHAAEKEFLANFLNRQK